MYTHIREHRQKSKNNRRVPVAYGKHHQVLLFYTQRIVKIGDARFVVEGTIYPLERGNILVMPSGQTHNLLLEPCNAYERIALLIDTSTVPSEFDFLSEQVYSGNNLFELTKSEQICFEESFSIITKVQDDLKNGLIFSFASMIFSLLSTKLTPNKSVYVQDDLVKKTVNYINKNLTADLSLDTIAAKLYCSKSSLNRKFNEIMGCTVWEYVIRRRIYNARQILFFFAQRNRCV